MTVKGRRSRRCRACIQALDRNRSILRRGGAMALVPYGMSMAEYRRVHADATRRSRYGQNGRSPKELAMLRQRMTEGPFKKNSSPKTHCKRGHPFTPENTYFHSGERRCRTCTRNYVRKGRPEWVTVNGAEVSVYVHDCGAQQTWTKLRQAVIETHPDKTHRKSDARHIKAKKALDAFLAAEEKWYASVGVPPPNWKVYRPAGSRKKLLDSLVPPVG